MRHLVVTQQWGEFGMIADALQSKGVSNSALHLVRATDINPPLETGKETLIYQMFLLDLPGGSGSTANLEAFGLKMAEAMATFAMNPDHTILVLYPNSRFTTQYAIQGLKKVFDDLRQHFPNAPIFDTLKEAIEWVVTEFSKDLVLS